MDSTESFDTKCVLITMAYGDDSHAVYPDDEEISATYCHSTLIIEDEDGKEAYVSDIGKSIEEVHFDDADKTGKET